MNHRLFRISILVLLAVDRLMAVRLANSSCHDTYCLYLWEADDTAPDGYTWSDSVQLCRDSGTRLASVADANVQKNIRELLDGTVGCWIDGRRSQSDTWQYLDGKPFERMRPPGDGYCIHYEFHDKVYNDDNCDELNSQATSVCEITIHNKASCHALESSSVWFAEVCYVIQNKHGSWYQQQTLCANTDPSGHLPYTHIRNETLLGLINNAMIALNFSRRLMWTGIVSHQWEWDLDDSPETMNYFAWKIPPRDVDMGSIDCVSIESNDATWTASDCTTTKQHVLCLKDIIESTTPAHQTDSTGPQNDTTPGTTSPSLTIIVAAVVAVVVVVVIVVVVVAVIMLRKRRARMSSKGPEKHVNNNNSPKDNSSNEQGGPSDTSDSQYAEIDLDEPMPENTISPYGEYEPPPSSAPGPKNRVSAFFSGMAARIHGSRLSTTEDGCVDNELYSQSRKQHGSRLSTTEDECVDNELYSQSRKRLHTMDSRKKQKPVIKTKKPSKLMRSLRPEVGDPPNGVVAERPEIEHIESPTGDIYAMSMKPVKDLTYRSRESFI